MPTNSQPAQTKCSSDNTHDYTRTFSEVYLAELDYIKERRIKMDIPSDQVVGECERLNEEFKIQPENDVKSDIKPNAQTGLVGLALSGGGVRSATFNLGILQSLAKNKVLQYCDYISTVSGGGYIGSCLSSLLAQEPNASTKPDEFPLRSQCGDESEKFLLKNQCDKERAEVKHLGQNANYLGLGRGFLSLDTWQATEKVVFGILLTNMSLISFGLFLSLILYFLHFMFDSYSNTLVHLLVYILTNYLFHPLESPLEVLEITIRLALLALVPALVLFFMIFMVRFCQVAFFHEFYLFKGSWINILTAIMYTCLLLVLLFLFLSVMVMMTNDLATFSFFPSFSNFLENFDEGVKKLPVLLGISSEILFVKIILFFCGISILWFVLIGIGWVMARNRSEREILTISLRAVFLAILTIMLFLFPWVLFPDYVTKMASELSVGIMFSVVLILASLFININYTSLHSYYRDRLSEAYLIKRVNQKEEIEPNDSLKLTALHQYHNGPYHLINATLNVPHSKNSFLKGADFFVFSRYYCGAESTGYQKTTSYNQGETKLATAMAISGAAVSPIMGPATHPIAAFLMTLLNVRLNQWMPNPDPEKNAKLSSPIYLFKWPVYLFKELFRWGRETDALLNLSDGGHLENLGIYPLLKRRCRLIIVSDVNTDLDYQMKEFFILLRRASIDLGISICISLRDLRPNDDENRYTTAHFVKGTIHYPDNETGVLFLLKASLTGKEPEDLLKYQTENSSFPHQTTVDQFFDQKQFDAYRKLGELVADDVCPKVKEEVAQIFGKEPQFDPELPN